VSISKQHFSAIAEEIRVSVHDFKSPTAHARFAANMATTLATFNPRFDRARFIDACTPRHYVGTRHANAFERASENAKCGR